MRYRLVHSADEIAAFRAEVGDRIIVKPVDGVASLHIHPVDGPEDAAKAWQALQEADISTVIAEEYLDGPVVSVDSFARGPPPHHRLFRVPHERAVRRVGGQHPSRYAAPWLAELRELTPKLLDAVGLTEGPSHSEFVLTPKGPRVLESHARLAGSGAPSWFAAPSGSTSTACSSRSRSASTNCRRPRPSAGGAAVRFFTPSRAPSTRSRSTTTRPTRSAMSPGTRSSTSSCRTWTSSWIRRWRR
ncbi:ATP-grasp domain-containing protein [Streptomyces sp. M10(2022)]